MLAACHPRPPAPLVPVPLAPVERDSAIVWARATLPPRTSAIRFRWHYQDERVKYAGRGSARVAPPDSMRCPSTVFSASSCISGRNVNGPP